MQGTSQKVVDRVISFEEEAASNLLVYLRKAVDNYVDGELRRVSQWLLRSKDTEDMVRRVGKLMRGSWRDDVALGMSVVSGLTFGHVLGSLLPASLGPVPYVALVGLGALIPGRLAGQRVVSRNVFHLGGLSFMAGAFFGARSPS